MDTEHYTIGYRDASHGRPYRPGIWWTYQERAQYQIGYNRAIEDAQAGRR